jgi:hypothetical protein
MTADFRRILDGAREVFIRLDADATRQLQESWRGEAGRRALEALRRYISDALDGLGARPSLPGIAMPATPASNPPGTPAGTVPAGLDAVPPTVTSPIASRHNGFDDFGYSTPTHTAASLWPSHTPPPTAHQTLDNESRMPAAPFNAAASSAAPSPVPTGSTSAPRAAVPFAPLMGGAYPGAFGRDEGGSRRTPGYLISIDNGNELIGPLPKVSPPVIGR